MSESVAKALAYYGDADTIETQRFIMMFDRFFDCLNVRHPAEYIQRRKPNLKPYISNDDERFTVSFFKFLYLPFKHCYLSGWRKIS